ncbi:MAG TPA: hypothetical protein VF622_05230 [Segetibacter sp.]|jgi:hypothetical protein
MTKIILPVLVIFATGACTQPATVKNHNNVSDIEKIQKDPLYKQYMDYISQNNFTDKYDFPIIPNAEDKEKQARENGTITDYYKSIKDINYGVSWYDAVIVPQNKRMQLFAELYKKYVGDSKMPAEILKSALLQNRTFKRD